MGSDDALRDARALDSFVARAAHMSIVARTTHYTHVEVRASTTRCIATSAPRFGVSFIAVVVTRLANSIAR